MKPLVAIVSLSFLTTCFSAPPPDIDGDGIPDIVEQKLGMDPRRPDKLALIHDDKAMGQGDTNHGRDLRDAYDFTRVYFGNVAHNRYVWRVDFTRPPQPDRMIAFIIYVDTDNDPSTGRADGARGTDIMIRPGSVQAFGPMRQAAPRGVAAVVGSTLYFVVDAPLRQEEGKSVFRCWLLSQHRGADRRRDSDHSVQFLVKGPGNSDRGPVPVPKAHPLYVAPPEFRNVGARVFFEADGRPRVHVTWITSWPTRSRVGFGTAPQCTEQVQTPRAVRNHRIVLRDLKPDSTYFYRVVGIGRAGRVVRGEVLQFDTTRPARKPCTVARGEIQLTVENPTGHRLRAWPVTSGLPFPAGALTSPDRVRLLSPDGKETPCQVRVTARWLDRSVKWLLLDCQVELEPNEKRVWMLEYGEEVERQSFESPLRTTTSDGVTTVLTGPMRLQFGEATAGVLGRVWLDTNGDGRFAETERIADGAEVALIDGEGQRYSSAMGPPDEAVVEESGPMRVSVKMAGPHVNTSGKRLFRYTARVQAYAGQAFVRVSHTFANDRTEAKFTNIRSLSLVTQPNLRGPTRCAMAAEQRVVNTQPKPSAPTRLFQNFDDHFSLTGPGKTIEGRRTAGWMRLADECWGVTAAVRNFWQLYPKSLSSDGRSVEVGICPTLLPTEYDDRKADEDKLYYYLLKGQYKLKCGVSKTHELLYCFHPPDQAQEAEAYVAALNDPLITVAPPEWYCDSMAFGEITPATDGEFPEYEAMVGRIAQSFRRNRETQREYGMLNYGDYYGERRWNWGNIEYDTQHGFLMQFARTGNRDYYLLAEAAARHNVDVDHIHFHAKPEYVGRAYCHCIGHVGDYYPAGFRRPAIARGGYNTGHAWNRGNLEYYFLSGYRRAGEVAMMLSDMQAWSETINHRVRGAERGTAWPMFAAVAAYGATCDEYYLNAARLYVDAVAEQQTDAGHWNIPAGYSKVVPMPVGGYAWCTGLLLTALEDYYDETGDERAATAAAKAGEWLLRTEWIPETQGFRATSCDSFNKRTPPGCECYRVPPGLGFVHDVTGERRFIDVALAGFAHAVRRGGGGKGGSVALCTTPHFIHDLKRLGITRLPEPVRPVAIELPYALALLPSERAVLAGRVRGSRGRGQTFTVRVERLPTGWIAAPMSQTVVAKPSVAETAFRIELTIPREAHRTGKNEVHLALVGNETDVRREVRVAFIDGVRHGDRIGLIAGKDDFLGPALKKAGVDFQTVADAASDLTRFGAIWLGTQAHTLDAAHISSNPLALHRYVKSGGLLVISQMNDDNWEPGYLPCRIVLSEDNRASGKIANPEHAIFRTPHRIAEADGIEMYDTIESCEPRAKILLEDHEGRPAIVEITCGYGRVLLFQPSVERYYAGGEAEGSGAQMRHSRLFENIVAYVRARVAAGAATAD